MPKSYAELENDYNAARAARKSPAEILADYFENSKAPKPVFALIERHTLTPDKPAGTILTFGTSRRDIERHNQYPNLTRMVKICAC